MISTTAHLFHTTQVVTCVLLRNRSTLVTHSLFIHVTALPVSWWAVLCCHIVEMTLKNSLLSSHSSLWQSTILQMWNQTLFCFCVRGTGSSPLLIWWITDLWIILYSALKPDVMCWVTCYDWQMSILDDRAFQRKINYSFFCCLHSDLVTNLCLCWAAPPPCRTISSTEIASTSSTANH